VKTSAVFFPFDLFGSPGAGDGSRLLADAVREMLADNRREKIPTRARAYQPHVRLRELPFDSPKHYQDWRERGRKAARDAWRRGDFLLWVGGNHLAALPLYDELAGQDDVLVVQFDAHLDVYNLSDCTAEVSHGNFLLHCARPLPHLVNTGNRELLLRPEYVADFYEATFSAATLAIDPQPALDWLRRRSQTAQRVVLDLDCDVFDPTCFPAVSHPQPFGVTPGLLLRLLDAVWSDRVIGFAVSEFDPARDVRDLSLSTLVWLIEYLLLKRHE
jgi:arginase family enzyme